MSEQLWSCRAPIVAPCDLGQQGESALSVAPIRLRHETLRKRSGQRVLLDPAMIAQRLDDGDRHMGVIGPHPRRRGKFSLSQALARGAEEAFAECISH